MRLFGRMWLWSQCDADHRRQQQQRKRTNADQLHAGDRIHLSRVGDTTVKNGDDARRIHHRVQRIKDIRQETTGSCVVIHQSWCWWWKIVVSMLQLLSLVVVVEGYVTDYGARCVWTNHFHTKVSYTPTTTTSAPASLIDDTNHNFLSNKPNNVTTKKGTTSRRGGIGSPIIVAPATMSHENIQIKLYQQQSMII